MVNAPDPADELFVVPPEEFVAARNALVKQLRAAGERERASDVAAMRRPSVPDWALNMVAHGQAAQLEPFLDAAKKSREAQRAAASGREGVDLRGALQGLRAASEAVVRAAVAAAKDAGRATGALTAPISTRLQEVAASAGLSDQLRQGRLGTGDAEADDLFDGDEPSARSRTTGSRQPAGTRRDKPGPAAKPSGGKRSGAKAEPTLEVPDPKRRRQLEKALAAASRAHAKTTETRDAAAGRLEEAERRVTEAEEALARAQAEREEAIERRDVVTAALDAASSDVERAEADLAEAEAALAEEPA